MKELRFIHPAGKKKEAALISTAETPPSQVASHRLVGPDQALVGRSALNTRQQGGEQPLGQTGQSSGSVNHQPYLWAAEGLIRVEV